MMDKCNRVLVATPIGNELVSVSIARAGPGVAIFIAPKMRYHEQMKAAGLAQKAALFRDNLK